MKAHEFVGQQPTIADEADGSDCDLDDVVVCPTSTWQDNEIEGKRHQFIFQLDVRLLPAPGTLDATHYTLNVSVWADTSDHAAKKLSGVLTSLCR